LENIPLCQREPLNNQIHTNELRRRGHNCSATTIRGQDILSRNVTSYMDIPTEMEAEAEGLISQDKIEESIMLGL